MPDWDIELTRTFGKGRVLTRNAFIEDVEQQAVAEVAGIEQCLEWANEPNSPIPLAALEYWQQAKGMGMMPYEVRTELESRWNLTFICKRHVDMPAPAGAPEPRLNGRTAPPIPQGRGSNPDLLDQLKQRYIELLETQKRQATEIAILERLFGKPKRKYERKGRPRRSALQSSQGRRNRKQNLRRVPQDNRKVRDTIGGPDLRGWRKPFHKHDDTAIGADVGQADGIAQGISAAINADAGKGNG